MSDGSVRFCVLDNLNQNKKTNVQLNCRVTLTTVEVDIMVFEGFVPQPCYRPLGTWYIGFFASFLSGWVEHSSWWIFLCILVGILGDMDFSKMSWVSTIKAVTILATFVNAIGMTSHGMIFQPKQPGEQPRRMAPRRTWITLHVWMFCMSWTWASPVIVWET